MYMRLGYHNDHVKCLAYSSGGGWVASGGLDRRVMIWDTQEGREREIVGFAVSSSVFCHDKSPQASIYALACNPAGTTVVSGSPDKVVRVWDPRSGKQAIGLTGHRDNVRGLLVSDDGKWVLSASSDTTIKLWSLSQPQRCMVTYTHYEDSVWCLYSNHPDLDTFWAGGRDGLVTKMSRRRMGGGDVKSRVEDELVDCVAVCKETGPVHKLVAVDDMFVWTATNSSSINRWRDIPFRQATVVPSREMIPDDPDGAVYIPKASIIQQHRGGAGILGGRRASGAGAGASGGGGGGGGGGAASFKGTELSRSASLISRDTYSLNQRPGGGSLVSGVAAGVAASANSTTAPRAGGGGEEGEEDEDSLEDVVVEPVWTQPDHVIVGGHGIQRCSLMNNRIHAVTEDTVGRCAMWDIVKCVKVKDFAEDVKFQDACDSVNTFEWIANWCTLDTKNGYLTVHLEESKFHEAEIYFESLGLGVSPQNEDVRVNIGKWVLTYLFICYKHVCHQQVPAAAVMYHDHYLGALTYTHLGAPPDSTTHYLFGQSVYYGPPDLQFDTKISQQPLLQQHSQPSQPIKPQSQMQPNSSKETASTDGQTPGGDAGYVRAPRKESLGAASAVKLDAGPVSESGNEEKGVLNSLPAQDVGACAANGGEGEKELGDDTPLVAVRLRPKPLTNVAARPESLIQVDGGLNYVAQIVKRPIPYAPNPDELPPIRIPPDVSLLVSCEEAPEAACYLDQFRSTVGQIGWVREAMRLDECIPRWVAETLMDKKLKDLPKMSFMMMPHPYSNLQELPNNANRLSSSRMIRLRKLLAYVADNANIQPPMHLVKVAYQAQNQPPNQQPPSQSVDEAGGKRLQGSWSGVVNPGSVEAIPGVSASPGNDTASVKSGGGGSLFGSRRKRAATSGAASTATTTNDSKDDGFVLPSDVNVRELVKPEEYLELCCQDKPLEPKMTLGTVKNLIWKSGGGDLTLTYRRKNV
ncbi:hypothetical protein BC830DRAFT_1082008 [Chytriomyces sp. MP71]|nr:hypothetical protein BC830DRAFT_1082008 [Chytriomyces sp. MP71]